MSTTSSADVATDPGYFTYYSSCTPDAKIVLGDARLTLADASEGFYDLIIVDAFSSDAIPIHLLTQEAMAIYLAKLAPGGIVLMHISNRHMELASVLAAFGKAEGFATYDKQDDQANTFTTDYHANAEVVVLARDTEVLHR